MLSSIPRPWRPLLLAPALLAALAWPAQIQAQTQSQEDARVLMLHARALQRQAGGDDPEQAVALYRKVIALIPQSAEAHLRLSQALVECGDVDGAAPPAIQATELDPKNAEAWIHLGFLQFVRQKDENAPTSCRKALTEAAKLLPGDAEVWLRLAQICQLMKDDEGAMNAWIRLGRLHPQGTLQDNRPIASLAWERAAEIASSLGRYEQRREAIMALCRKNRPEARHLRLLEELARTQVDKGFLGHAEESFLLLAQHVFGEPGIWENIARIQIQTDRFEEALKSLQMAQALKEAPRTSFFQAICFMNLGKLKEAEASWKSYFKLEGSEPDKEMRQNSCFGYATCLLMQNRPKEVIEQLATWPETRAFGDLLGLQAQAQIQTQGWKAARTTLRDGIQRFPKQSIFARANRLSGDLDEGLFSGKKSRRTLNQLDLESMAALWAEFRQWGTCLELVEKIRKTVPSPDVDLLLLQANALEQLDRPIDSLKIYREAQKLKPDDPMLQNNLGYLLLEKGGDLDEASRLVEASLKQNPKDPSTLDSWGCVLLKQGKMKEAESAIRKAVDLRPYNPDIRKHLGEALLALDRPEEALEQWERALAFAFPERKELEIRARKLRVDLAKQGRSAAETTTPDNTADKEPDASDEPETEEEP